MKLLFSMASLFLASATLVPATLGFAQQTTPSTTPDAAPAASSAAPASSAQMPAAAQDLPDSPVTQAPPPSPEPTGPTAVLDTTMGRITCRLFDKQAPLATANFIGLAEGTRDWVDPTTHAKMHGKPLYNGTQFHRVIPDFMIQGGDPTATGMGDPGYLFEDEVDPALNFDVPGRLAMANSGPGTNGSQFFITEAPTPHLNGKHTIFGQCDAPSVDVVKTIARVPRDSNDKPQDPVILNKVTIVREGQPMPPAPSAAAAPATPSAPATPNAPKP